MTQPDQPSAQRLQHEIHFAPGEFQIFVRHPANTSPDELRNAITRSGIFEIDFSSFGFKRAPEPYISTDRIITFNEQLFTPTANNNRAAFSFVFVEIQENIGERNFLHYIRSIDTRVLRLQPDGPIFIEIATPNWLSCGSPQNNGSGGPGARPVPASTDAPLNHFPNELGLDEQKEPLGQCTTVFILDTAPCDVDLKRAYRTWVEQPLRGQGTLNQRLDKLIGPSGALGYVYDGLRVEYAGHNHLLESANAHLPDHNYVMSDHGLFVASVINEYAPGARLHLIEVLNPYGVGTLETIAHGFARAAEYAIEHPCEHIVVNASLFLDVAQPDIDSFEVLVADDPFWNWCLEEIEPSDPPPPPAEIIRRAIERTVSPLDEVCKFLSSHKISVIAAAGNDAGKGTAAANHVRPKARFPAAYDTVLGVGALNADNSIAVYSNEPDQPPRAGVEAFGGNASGDLSDPNFGAIGVYIGKFPDRQPNLLGLARWSGTSFATPVITAAFATMLCAGLKPEEAMEQAKAKFPPQPSTSTGTAGGN